MLRSLTTEQNRSLNAKGSRSILGARCFLEARGTMANKTHKTSKNDWVVGLAAFGGKAKKPLVSEKRVLVGIGTSGLQQKHLDNKNTSGSL